METQSVPMVLQLLAHDIRWNLTKALARNSPLGTTSVAHT